MSLIAVTGGTGTLGQNLVPAALARGDEVRVLSRRACAAVAEGASLAVADVLTGQGFGPRPRWGRGRDPRRHLSVAPGPSH